MSDTIAAIATPAAPAGLGVIRLSGEGALAVAARVFRPADPARTADRLAGYTAAYGHVYDAEGDIDECVLLVFRAPRSYTGENVAELSCHGGLYLLRRVLRACLTAGARLAQPGEFTRRAFLAGKMDLTQAESVTALIAADGRLAARTALAAHEGATYRRLQAVKDSLLAVEAASLPAAVPACWLPQAARENTRTRLVKIAAIRFILKSPYCYLPYRQSRTDSVSPWSGRILYTYRSGYTPRGLASW